MNTTSALRLAPLLLLAFAGCSLTTAPVANVAVEIEVADPVVPQDGATEVTLTVRNLTRQTVRIGGSSTCMLTHGIVGRIPSERICTADFRTVSIPPRGRYERTLTFHPRDPEDPQMLLPAGSYSLVGILQTSGVSIVSPPVEIEVLTAEG